MRHFTKDNFCTSSCAESLPTGHNLDYAWCGDHHMWWKAEADRQAIYDVVRGGGLTFPGETLTLEERMERERAVVKEIPHIWTRVLKLSEVPYNIRSQL